MLEHLDRFAALLGHLLQHVDDQVVVLDFLARCALLDVAVLDLGEDQADRGRPLLVAALHRGNLGGFDRVAEHGASTFLRMVAIA
ncbi:hypothetical protein D3C83_105860 [compost metagenome]